MAELVTVAEPSCLPFQERSGGADPQPEEPAVLVSSHCHEEIAQQGRLRQ